MAKMQDSLYRTILVPVDGSHSSLHAEEFAVAIARTFNSRVQVLHVIPKHLIQLTYDSMNSQPLSHSSDPRAHFEQKGRQIIANAKALFSEENIPVETKLIEYGDPIDYIRHSCIAYDLVVMGATGENSTTAFTLGTVSKEIIRRSTCSVLLVKDRLIPSRIISLLDGVNSSYKAVKHAVALAQNYNAEITFLPIQSQKKTEYIAMLENAQTFAEAKGITVKSHQVVGSVGDNIPLIVEEENFELLVMPKQPQRGISRFWRESINEKIAKKARCSVLLVN